MSHNLLRRLGQSLLVLWAAFTLSFVLLQVLPGDAVLIKFQNPDLGLSPAQIADMRIAYGADSPIWTQYFHTLAAMLQGILATRYRRVLRSVRCWPATCRIRSASRSRRLYWLSCWPLAWPSPHACRGCAG
jgi:ABC-type dipeptide/oligopeptide/nickel transport system permease component